ncbi:MAG: serine hydrolase, partial [Bacteroidota bacterium]
GNEVWFKKFGGKSYDLAHSILATADGYLIIGSTSSYGNGNYDVFIIKTDKEGKKQWQNTFGGHFNEYGYVAEKTKNGYLIKGTMQQCTDEANILEADCTTNVYLIHIDRNGRMLSEEIREEMVE